MKNILSILLLILLMIFHSEALSADELQYYDSSATVPKPDKDGFKERTLQTMKTMNSPFFVQSERFAEEESRALIVLGPIGKVTKTFKTMVNYERLVFTNATDKKFENLYLAIEYYYYKTSYKDNGQFQSRFKRVDQVEEDKPKARLYDIRVFKLNSLEPQTKTVIDTPGFDIFMGGRPAAADEIIYYNMDGSMEKTLAISDYAGYILSIFSGNKLLYQITNNKDLREKGLSKLSENILEKHLKN